MKLARTHQKDLIPRAQNCLETLEIIPFQFKLKSSRRGCGCPPPVLHDMGHEDARCNPCTEEMEVEERAEEEECENDGVGGSLLCSYGTPPDSPGNLLSFPRFFGPGEFDPSVDVYAMKSHESKSSCRSAQPGPVIKLTVRIMSGHT